MRIRIHNTEPHNLPHLFSMRSSALKTSKLSVLAKTLAGPHIKWPLSPVLHEIERVEMTSKLSALTKTLSGPHIKWPLLFSMRSSVLKRRQSCRPWTTLAGPHIKWPLTLFSMRSSELKRRQSCQPWQKHWLALILNGLSSCFPWDRARWRDVKAALGTSY